jgi:hypothetical protein
MAPRRTFGHARRGGQTPPPAEPPAPASLDSLSEEEYARLVEPLRQSTEDEAGGSQGLLALFTTSSYRYWLWIGLGGGALLLVLQALGIGDGALTGLRDAGQESRSRTDGDGVEITELAFEEGVGEGDTVGVRGQVRNGGEGTLVGLTVALAFHDCPDGYTAGLEECTHHDEVYLAAEADVPPGEAGAFNGAMALEELPPIEGTLEVTFRLEGAEFR